MLVMGLKPGKLKQGSVMDWQTYRIVFRLCTPLHSGQSKVGNVQLTRPYVIGRALWGALTARLTRDQHQGQGPATQAKLYENIGKEVHETLALTYFYPALKVDNDYQISWPWDNETAFRACFLGSYASTALSYPHHSASEGSLHEVEFITPMTQDDGCPVYLVGYIFARNNGLDWPAALHRLQLGGERGYGWGRVSLAEAPKLLTEQRIFDLYSVQPGTGPPVIEALNNDSKPIPLLAHTLTTNFSGPGIQGAIEPLVGRETQMNKKASFGAIVSTAQICWTPGTTVSAGVRFTIGRYGIWEVV